MVGGEPGQRGLEEQALLAFQSSGSRTTTPRRVFGCSKRDDRQSGEEALGPQRGRVVAVEEALQVGVRPDSCCGARLVANDKGLRGRELLVVCHQIGAVEDHAVDAGVPEPSERSVVGGSADSRFWGRPRPEQPLSLSVPWTSSGPTSALSPPFTSERTSTGA